MKSEYFWEEFAKKELNLINFDQSNLKETMLAFLEQNSKISNNDPALMKEIINLLTRLVDGLPLSAITQEDFVPEYHSDDKSIPSIYRCTRYSHVFKRDDKYWDDRAVSFKFLDSNNEDVMYIYQSNYNSRQEITLPYYPNPVVKIISKEDLISIDKFAEHDPEPDYEVE